MPTDKQNVEFMWAIVKQLEIKHIDWNIVASANSISNGHAARMRFHRLRQAMEGIATKHRTAKTMEDGPEKSMGKDKTNTKISKSRKAKDLALKRKLADVSDDEEEPLAHVKARLRMKEELEDSEDEYVDSETEEKRAVQKQIRREEAIKMEQDERSVSPKTVKVEKVDCPTSFSSRIESTPLKVEIMEDPFLIMEPGEAIAVKSEFVLEDDAVMIDSAPTPIDDMEIKEEGFEALVEPGSIHNLRIFQLSSTNFPPYNPNLQSQISARKRLVLVHGKDADLVYAIVKQMLSRSIDWIPVADTLGLKGKTRAHTARMRFVRYREHRGDLPAKSKRKTLPGKAATEEVASKKVKCQASVKSSVARTEKTPQIEGGTEDDGRTDVDDEDTDEDEPIMRSLARCRRASEAFSDSDYANAGEITQPSEKRAKHHRGEFALMSNFKQARKGDQALDDEEMPHRKNDEQPSKVTARARKKKAIGKLVDKAGSEVDGDMAK